MGRKFQAVLAVFVVAGFYLFNSPCAWAQRVTDNENADSNIAGRLGIGARYGFVDKNEQIARHEGSASIIYGFSDYAALEVEGGVIGSRKHLHREIYTGFADLVFRLPISNLVPYARAGIGVQNHKFRDLGEWNNSFSQRAGAGLEYFFDRNWAINAEAIYVWGGNNTFDAPRYRAGIKFYF